MTSKLNSVASITHDPMAPWPPSATNHKCSVLLSLLLLLKLCPYGPLISGSAKRYPLIKRDLFNISISRLKIISMALPVRRRRVKPRGGKYLEANHRDKLRVRESIIFHFKLFLAALCISSAAVIQRRHGERQTDDIVIPPLLRRETTRPLAVSFSLARSARPSSCSLAD